MSKKFHATLNRLVEQSANNNPRRARRNSSRMNPRKQIIRDSQGTQHRVIFNNPEDHQAYLLYVQGGGKDVEFTDDVFAAATPDSLLSSPSDVVRFADFLSRSGGAQEAEAEVEREDSETEEEFSRFGDVESERGSYASATTPAPERQRRSFYSEEDISEPRVSPETASLVQRRRKAAAFEDIPRGVRSSRESVDQYRYRRPVQWYQYKILMALAQAPNTRKGAKGSRLRYAVQAENPRYNVLEHPLLELEAKLRRKKKKEKLQILAEHFQVWSDPQKPIMDITFHNFLEKMKRITLPRAFKIGNKEINIHQWGQTPDEVWGPLLQEKWSKAPCQYCNRQGCRACNGTGYQQVPMAVRPGILVARRAQDSAGDVYDRKGIVKPYRVKDIDPTTGEMVLRPDLMAWELAARIALGTFLKDTGYRGAQGAKLKEFRDPSGDTYHMYVNELDLTADALKEKQNFFGLARDLQNLAVDADFLESEDTEGTSTTESGNQVISTEAEETTIPRVDTRSVGPGRPPRSED
jgi:hypothetical protein